MKALVGNELIEHTSTAEPVGDLVGIDTFIEVLIYYGLINRAQIVQFTRLLEHLVGCLLQNFEATLQTLLLLFRCAG